MSLDTVESKNTEAHQKADAERAVMKRDLLTVNSHLRSVTCAPSFYFALTKHNYLDLYLHLCVLRL